jgi:general secretion pathway protein G
MFTISNYRNGRRDFPAFSLLEMMAVISLILILATVALPIYHTIQVRAREATLRQNLFTLRSQIDRFTHDYERGPESGRQ